MVVLCANCGCSLANNWILEDKAHEDGHSVYCKTCAKAYRKGDHEKLKRREGNQRRKIERILSEK